MQPHIWSRPAIVCGERILISGTDDTRIETDAQD
jgi:hypothetical protein